MIMTEIIRNRRRELKITQRQLGELCGYSGRSAETVIQNWEYGKQPVPLDKLRVLANALHIPLDVLIP